MDAKKGTLMMRFSREQKTRKEERKNGNGRDERPTCSGVSKAGTFLRSIHSGEGHDRFLCATEKGKARKEGERRDGLTSPCRGDRYPCEEGMGEEQTFLGCQIKKKDWKSNESNNKKSYYEKGMLLTG